MKTANIIEDIMTNKILATKIKEIEKEITEKNKILCTLNAEKNVLFYEYEALKTAFEKLTGNKWDTI
jgi:hypothetical protein